MTVCCIKPERSQSPEQPIRLVDLDPIFAVTALPHDHPHALRVKRPPSVDQTLVRSPSIVSKLKSHLQRKSTAKSLKSQIYDADPGLLTSEDVLEWVKSEETAPQHGRSPSSSYSTEDMLAICRVFDGSAEVEASKSDMTQGNANRSVTESTVLSQELGTAFQDDPAKADGGLLSVPKAQDKPVNGGPIHRSSTSRTISTSQAPPSLPCIVTSVPTDAVVATSANPAPSAKDLLTPEGETFADYERKLSVCGDDRRWGASCDFQKMVEIQQEDKAATGIVARLRSSRSPSRASNTLMENALGRQLQEKALFRSASKLDVQAPSFVTTTCTRTLGHTQSSWCKWPSYDRGYRAGATGIEDDVHVRDFATPQPYTDRGHLVSPVVIKLKNVKRYYTDLFTTSGFHGKGHRTSIWGSGKLRDPELEMLPPSMPTFANEEPPDWVEGKRCSLPTGQRSSVPTEDKRRTLPVGQGSSVQTEDERGSLSVQPMQRLSISQGKRNSISVDTRRSSALVEQSRGDLPTFKLMVQSDGAHDMSAEQFSAMYSDCVSRPFSPVKITRYPSATVIDDRKGHWRSISLVSEKSFLRESSHDLLQLVEREKERCERLIMG
ncbi:hypothetical protein AMS68_003806 [Peltaster fructicola]|uniref:Uncharacterized protein n=1 Tax=Peltaster fructicola TaxID=286661 RepID=A0A6H0XUI5_9PEZI|nr:hypothetical protein AMS68_003806 [Peltaster fructicola]